MTEESRSKVSVFGNISDHVARNLDAIFGEVDPDKIFSTLERTDDRVVLGVSTLERAGGFGFGGGEGPDQEGGGGGGGGGVGQARPIAIIEITSSGVQIFPVVDYSKLGLAALAVLAAIWRARH